MSGQGLLVSFLVIAELGVIKVVIVCCRVRFIPGNCF